MTMPDLAMHILDIAENAIRASARNVTITIDEDSRRNVVELVIADDGCGMTKEELACCLDPFFTTKKARSKVGLGLPFLKETAEGTGGKLEVVSSPGKGTQVRATLVRDHIDRPPMGDLGEILEMLIAANPSVNFHIVFRLDGESTSFSTDDADLAEAASQ